MPRINNFELAQSIRDKLNDHEIVKNQLSGTRSPLATDDSSEGYERGSLWVDSSQRKAWIAVSVTADSAAWIDITDSGGRFDLPTNLALTGDSADSDDGVKLNTLFETIEAAGTVPITINLYPVNDTDRTRKIFINSTVRVPSQTTLDFGNMDVLFGPNGRIRTFGNESEIAPGTRPGGGGFNARIGEPMFESDTSLVLDSTHSSSLPSLFNVGEYIVIRGENDATGGSLQRDIVQITSIDSGTFTLNFDPPLENDYQVSYPLSAYTEETGIEDFTTITIKEMFLLDSDAAAGSTTLKVPSGAIASLRPGDWVEVEDNVLVKDLYPLTASANQVHVDIIQIKEIDSGAGTITLIRELLHDYTVANNAAVVKLGVVENAQVRNAKISFTEAQSSRNIQIMEARYAVNCTYDNIHVNRNWEDSVGHVCNALRVYKSHGVRVNNVSTYSPKYSAGGGEAYGYTIYHSYGTQMENVLAQGCRHSLLIQSAARNIVNNFTSHDCNISDIDLHGINERENVISNFTVVGGPTLSSSGIGGSRAGVRIGNTYHLAGAFDNVIQNGIVHFAYNPDRYSQGINILPSSGGNTVRNVKVIGGDVGILMTDASKDSALKSFGNVISDVTIEDTFDYAVRIDCNGYGGLTPTVDNLVLRDIDIRNCAKGVRVEQTNRVQLENITIIDQDSAGAQYGFELVNNTNLYADNLKMINVQKGIDMDSNPGAMINNVLFELWGDTALNDGGGNDGASVLNMKFKGTTAGHSFTGGSVFKSLTNAERQIVRKLAGFGNSPVGFTTAFPADASSAPLITAGDSCLSFTYTPITPRSVVQIDVQFPFISSSSSNLAFGAGLFDSDTCIAAAQWIADASGGGTGQRYGFQQIVETTGYDPINFSLRLGPRDSGAGTMTTGQRWGDPLGDPYVVVTDLGIAKL